MTSTRLITLLLAALALALAGCGGGDEEAATTTTPPAGTQPAATEPATPDLPAEAYGEADPEPGETLLRFVRAAGAGDRQTMWDSLSQATQASIGPTLSDFERGTSAEFEEGVGTLAETAEVELSRVLGQWGVAAVKGTRTVEGEEEFYAYGAAMVQEGDEWKLDLGGLVVTQLLPEPLEETDATPQVRASIGAAGPVAGALMWLDAEPFRAQRTGDTPFTATLTGRPAQPLAPGRHIVVVFASSGDTATALAWPFTVAGADAS